MKKFKKGLKFNYSMLYGGRVTATVDNVTDTEVVLTESWIAEDTLEMMSKSATYLKHTDENGDEYIVIWEYRGYEGKAYAEEI